MASFHGECFSTASLAISKDGGVVALDDLVDESVDAESAVDVGLHVLGREDLVEVVDLASIYLRLVNSLRLVLVGLHDFNLIATGYTQLRALKILPLFVRQNGPDSYGNLNSLTSRSEARLLLLWTEAERVLVRRVQRHLPLLMTLKGVKAHICLLFNICELCK